MWIWIVLLHSDIIYQYLEIRHSPCFKETQVSYKEKIAVCITQKICVLVTANKFNHTGIYHFSSPELKGVSWSKFVSYFQCELLTLLYMHLSQVGITRLIPITKNDLDVSTEAFCSFKREDHFANTKDKVFFS